MILTSLLRCLGTGLAALAILAGSAHGQTQNLPPKPAGYFTDQAGVVDASAGQALNEQLAQFERDTSNQILVAIYPNLPDQASVDQYSIDIFNSWHPGQKGKDNGAVLFVYVKDHKMFIVTGRGLEGSLPDATCKDIIRDVITPPFRQGDYTGGVQAGVASMIAATKGEYKGTGQTVQEQQQGVAGDDSGSTDSGGHFPFFLIIIIIFIVISMISRHAGYGSSPMIYRGGGWGGGGFGGFGGGGGGGGGGFSGFGGGGGSSAGGGAGGSW